MKYLIPLLLTVSCFAAFDETNPSANTPINTAYSEIRANFAAIATRSYDVSSETYGAVGDGSTNDETAIEAAITAAAVNGGLVFFPTTGNAYKFIESINVPANVSLVFAPGASLMGDGSATLDVNGLLVDTIHQVFESTMTATGFEKNDFVRPEWWGAVGDYDTSTNTGTDDNVAFQAAVNAVTSGNNKTVRITNSAYYLASPVEILAPGEIRIQGPAGAYAEDSSGSVQSNFYGVTGMECFFDIGGGAATSMFSIEFDGVKFCGTNGGTAVDSAIHITSTYTGPVWPLIIQRCFFAGFTTAAIHQEQAGLTYNQAFVSITKSAFHTSTYSYLVASGNKCEGLYFCDNRAHQGGRIKGTFGGEVRIISNNLEGQDGEPVINITASGNAPRAIIEGNRFESCNDGDYIIYIAASSSIGAYVRTAGNNWILCDADVAYIGTVQCDVDIQDPVTQYHVRATDCSEVDQVVGVTYTGFSMRAKDVISKALPSGVENADLSSSTTSGVIPTPFGIREYALITDNTAQTLTFDDWATPMAQGDLLVFNVLLKYYDVPSSYSSRVILKDNDGTTLTASTGTLSFITTDDWVVVTYMYVIEDAVSGTEDDALRATFAPYGVSGSGDGCMVAGYSVYKVLAANIATTEVSPYMYRSPYTVDTVNLLSTTTVPLNANGDTALYTVPTGKRCLLHKAILVAGADAGTSDISIGANGAETDFVGVTNLDNVDAAYDSCLIAPIPSATPATLKSYAAATVIEAQVANQAGSATNTVYLYGTLY